MGIEIKKASDSWDEKPNLSKFGKIAVVVGILLIVIFAVIFFISGANSKAVNEKEKDLSLAIDRCIIVCDNSTSVLGLSEADLKDYNSTKDGILKEKNTLKKAGLTTEAIGQLLTYAKDNQSVTDELNGSRNRLVIALNAYKKIKG